MERLRFSEAGFFGRLESFITAKNTSTEVTASVAEILAAVKAEGDAAVIRYVQKFDGHSWSTSDLRLPPASLRAAAEALPAKFRAAFEEAIECVRSFHEKGLPRNWEGTNPHGARVGERWYPVRRVGVYVPAGSVPLVSTVVMTTTLAKLAGVAEIAVFTPAGKDGRVSEQMLAAMHLCGVDEVYPIGGAHAVGAMAYGTATIPAVDKIVGPGNAYVTEAQRQVFGQVGIELLPGPSEALAIADGSARADWLAADLLAQAEHGTGREKVYYVFSDEAQSDAVEAAIEAQLGSLKHAAAIRKVLNESTLFLQVASLDEAIEVANFVAPEHLELHVAPEHFARLEREITTAGAMLFGHETPTVLGDFTAGPSHTLPTGRTGRFFSGLKITDFFRRTSLVQYDRSSLEKAREVISVFSALEDLDAHGRSMEIRFDS
jgi:histidinol dehydrogenase